MKAIDMHVHVRRQPGLPDVALAETLRNHFHLKGRPHCVKKMAEKYREWGPANSTTWESNTCG